jgi:hypothetical protein
MLSVTAYVTFLLIDDNIQMNYGYNRCAHIFQKARSHLKILDAGRVT